MNQKQAWMMDTTKKGGAFYESCESVQGMDILPRGSQRAEQCGVVGCAEALA